MKISVHVIDGIHGRRAEGIPLRIARPNGGERERVFDGVVGENRDRPDGGQEFNLTHGIYQIELDIDGYYSTFGIVPFCRRAIVAVRVLDLPEYQHIFIVITPCTYATYIVIGGSGVPVGVERL